MHMNNIVTEVAKRIFGNRERFWIGITVGPDPKYKSDGSPVLWETPNDKNINRDPRYQPYCMYQYMTSPMNDNWLEGAQCTRTDYWHTVCEF